jgi:hypothetical protein
MNVLNPIQDHIAVQLSAETTVVNKTVKIVISVNAMNTDNTSSETLKTNIFDALKNLIPEAIWDSSNQSRGRDDSGYERISMTVTTRVPEREINDLETRVEKISRRGLTFKVVETDISIPQSQLDEAERELRLVILQKALNEVTAINEVTKRAYRISNVSYGQQAVVAPKNRGSNVMMTAMSATPMRGALSDASGGGEDEGFGNSQKLSLGANIIFSVVVPV